MIICGIYKIISPSGRVYVGQSKNINRRWSEYFNNNDKIQSQTRLVNSLNKYGVESHIFEIVEECTELDLNCRERYWQDFYDVTGKNGMNCILQECGEKIRVFSDEMLKKKSDRMKGENNPMYGVIRPTEWREQQSLFWKKIFRG